jgi:1-acyl-sn-glycerol-3-phosphate acyltransferase
MALRAMLRSFAAVCVVSLAMVVCASLAMVCVALRLPTWTVDACARSFSRITLTVLGVRLRPTIWHTEAAELPDRLVVVSNHESHIDPFALILALKRTPRFVAKRSLFHIPIFGWALGAIGCIPVDRDRASGDIARLNDPKLRLRGHDMLFFAEGSRGDRGLLRPFKKGAFAFAITHQRPILPVGLGGSFECLRPHGLRINPGPMTIVVGEPIDVTEMTMNDRDRLRERVQEVVATLREQALRSVGSERANKTFVLPSPAVSGTPIPPGDSLSC